MGKNNNKQLPFSTDEVPQFVTYFTLILQGWVNVDWSCQIFPVMHCNSKKKIICCLTNIANNRPSYNDCNIDILYTKRRTSFQNVRLCVIFPLDLSYQVEQLCHVTRRDWKTKWWIAWGGPSCWGPAGYTPHPLLLFVYTVVKSNSHCWRDDFNCVFIHLTLKSLNLMFSISQTFQLSLQKPERLLRRLIDTRTEHLMLFLHEWCREHQNKPQNIATPTKRITSNVS